MQKVLCYAGPCLLKKNCFFTYQLPLQVPHSSFKSKLLQVDKKLFINILILPDALSRLSSLIKYSFKSLCMSLIEVSPEYFLMGCSKSKFL